MTETEWLRQELIAAKNLIARFSGLVEAEQKSLSIIHGVNPIPTADELLANAKAFNEQSVWILPEGVTKA